MRDFGGLENGLPYSTARITLDSAGQYYESSVAPLYGFVTFVHDESQPLPPRFGDFRTMTASQCRGSSPWSK